MEQGGCMEIGHGKDTLVVLMPRFFNASVIGEAILQHMCRICTEEGLCGSGKPKSSSRPRPRPMKWKWKQQNCSGVTE